MLLVTLLLAQVAFAAPISNINGITGRLELISCHGGWYANKSYVDTTLQTMAETCNTAPDEVECFENLVKHHLSYAPVSFQGNAIAGSKNFDMTIKTSNGINLFHSIRNGFHADGPDGAISLFFYRLGITNDPYVIDTGILTNDGKSVPMLMVPVKRRLLPDQTYFFFDCTLRWLY